MADNESFQPIIIGDSSQFLAPSKNGSDKRESLDANFSPKQRIARTDCPEIENMVKETTDRLSNLEISNRTYRMHASSRSQSVASSEIDTPPLPKRPPPQSSRSLDYSAASRRGPTNLDQAMQQMDERKLQSLFGGNLPEQERIPDLLPQSYFYDGEEETDVDDVALDFSFPIMNVSPKPSSEEFKRSPRKVDVKSKDIYTPTLNLGDASSSLNTNVSPKQTSEDTKLSPRRIDLKSKDIYTPTPNLDDAFCLPNKNVSPKPTTEDIKQSPRKIDTVNLGDAVSFPNTNLSPKPTLEESKRSPRRIDVKTKDYYTPTVNLEDAVQWPDSVPRLLRFGQKEVFEGQTLVHWFSSAIHRDHYLHMVLTKHDIRVVFSQFCTYLLAAGVLREHEPGPLHSVYRGSNMYYWTHLESTGNQHIELAPTKLTPMWPPPSTVEGDYKLGLKYTEAEHQSALVEVRQQYTDETNKLKEENQTELEKVRDEYSQKIVECKERIYNLQREVSRYQVLAGIEKYTQEALSEAQAAAGDSDQPISTYDFNGSENDVRTNGGSYQDRMIVVTGTPQQQMSSRYNNHTITPECVRDASSYPDRTTPDDKYLPPLHPPPELVPSPEKTVNGGQGQMTSPLGNSVSRGTPVSKPASQSNHILSKSPKNESVRPTDEALPSRVQSSSSVPPPPSSIPPPPSSIPPPPSSIPPPAPSPGMGPPAPPPPPPPPGMGPPPPPPLPGMGPPPPPPLPGMGPPPPPGTAVKIRGPTKPVISPKSPMKPLFWSRLQVHMLKQREKKLSESKLFWEKVEEPNVDLDEFDAMFCKLPVEKKVKTNNNKKKEKTKQVAKVIDTKRSQSVGIFLSSLRLEMADIENAILNLDTSVIDQEKLKAIYEMRATDDEIKLISKYTSKNPDTPLDKPDQFLFDLVQVPDFADRIYCFSFQESFQEEITVIDSKLNNLKMTCEDLLDGTGVNRIFGLILTFGNYMNGGSRTRGQADGFGLEILPKLRDVRGKDNRTSLLQYVVFKYIDRFEQEDAGTDRVKLPLPDPSDISQASLVNFDDIRKDMKRIKKDFESSEKRVEKVLQSSASKNHLEPFKTAMSSFFIKSKQELIELEELLEESHKKFEEIVIFFCVKPKSGDKDVTAGFFFSFWFTFCQDFKLIWKKEQQKITKERIKEAENNVKRLKEDKKLMLAQTRSKKAGGLKDRLARTGMF